MLATMRFFGNVGKGSGGELMDNPSLLLAISKLAAAGEEAGFTLEEMIDLLDRGLGVKTLLELICLAAERGCSATGSRRVSIPLGGVDPWGSLEFLC